MAINDETERITLKVTIPKEMAQSLIEYVASIDGSHELVLQVPKQPEPDLRFLEQPITFGELRQSITAYFEDQITDSRKLEFEVRDLIAQLKDLKALVNFDGQAIHRFKNNPWNTDNPLLDPKVALLILSHDTISDYPKKDLQVSKLGQTRYTQIQESLKLLLNRRAQGFVFEPVKSPNIHELYSVRPVTLQEIADYAKSKQIEARKIKTRIYCLRTSIWNVKNPDKPVGLIDYKPEKRVDPQVLEESIVEAVLTTTDYTQMNAYLADTQNKVLRLDRFTDMSFTILKQVLEALLKK